MRPTPLAITLQTADKTIALVPLAQNALRLNADILFTIPFNVYTTQPTSYWPQGHRAFFNGATRLSYSIQDKQLPNATHVEIQSKPHQLVTYLAAPQRSGEYLTITPPSENPNATELDSLLNSVVIATLSGHYITFTHDRTWHRPLGWPLCCKEPVRKPPLTTRVYLPVAILNEYIAYVHSNQRRTARLQAKKQETPAVIA